MGVNPDENIFNQVDEELVNSQLESNNVCSTQIDGEDSRQGAIIRNDIAQEMCWFKMTKKLKTTHENGEETKKDNVKWSQQMDIVLIDALLEQQANGNRVDGTFTTTAYNNVLKICRDKLKYPFDKEHLKNRMKTLKANFNACHDLFKGLSGFSWNSNTKLFEAEPEVWTILIESKPSAKKWRHTEIHHYDKLSELFAKDRANGVGAVSSKEKVQQWEKESNCNQFVNVENLDKVTSDCFESLSPQCNSQVNNATKGVKRKASMIESLDKYAENLQSGLTSVADALRKGNIIAERGRLRIYSEEEVYAELLNIEVPEHLQLDAFLFLIKSAMKMRAFFAVPKERRYELLLKLMFPSGQSSS
ncbi:uncharacterized protein At2g29880-like [Humulus lupulus]|uniref:uncharacterized protein At2g29880-like n=1 Tax=Humulus lupulus TaxID=3486 RepID=UPI002B413EF2|nr:uncharacterized protein At2g29880-like [Humulus lupulus]